MRDKKLIQLYITNMCNSHCKTCGIWKNKCREELSLKEIQKVILAFRDADYVIGGGEAILHKDIEKILNMLHNDGINYTLLSNCINIEKLMYLIKRYGVPAITISFDGLNHDDIRGVKGNYDNIIEFKSWCDFNDVRMKISYTYSKYNEKTFKEDMNFIENTLGFQAVYFCIAQDMSLLDTAEVDENFVAKNFEQILECDMIQTKDRNYIKGMISGIKKCCSSQNNVHTIYSNGDIVRCQSFKSKEVLGNIKVMTSSQIFNCLCSVENETCPFDSDCNLLCQRRYD